MSVAGTSPAPTGTCHAVTASTAAPVSLAWWIAHRSAALDASKPSTPTTMRGACSFGLLFMRSSLGRRDGPDGFDRVPGGVRVEVLTAQGIRAHVRPELVDQRDAGGDVQVGDLVVGDGVEVLDQRPQRVAVRDDEHASVGQQVRHDGVVPVGQQPRGDLPEGLRARPGLGREQLVAGVAELGVLSRRAERRWRGVIRPAPRHELLLAVVGAHLGLVPALQRPVVPPVEPPGPADRDPVAVRGRQGEVGRPDRPPLQRGVHGGGGNPVFGQQRPGAGGLLLARRGQAGVLPAGEDSGGVPFALPVAQHDQPALPTQESSSTARPGRVLPSMNSRLAPPTTVNALLPVMAWATASVPPAYGASSKTPIGPFQKTVLAWRMLAANCAADSGPMSRPIWSAGIASAATTWRGVPTVRSAAVMTSDGSSIWPGAARSR